MGRKATWFVAINHWATAPWDIVVDVRELISYTWLSKDLIFSFGSGCHDYEPEFVCSRHFLSTSLDFEYQNHYYLCINTFVPLWRIEQKVSDLSFHNQRSNNSSETLLSLWEAFYNICLLVPYREINHPISKTKFIEISSVKNKLTERQMDTEAILHIFKDFKGYLIINNRRKTIITCPL